jgi:hypothetical protein
VVAFLLVEDDVAGDPGAERRPVLVDTILLEQWHDHAGENEGAPQPQENPVEELTPAVSSGKEQRTYARRNQAPNRLTIIE